VKPGETIRCTCRDCLIVFEIFLAPVADWPEEMEDDSDAEMEVGPPEMCPFCGSGDLRINPISQTATQH
jgi:hypothetical protein